MYVVLELEGMPLPAPGEALTLEASLLRDETLDWHFDTMLILSFIFVARRAWILLPRGWCCPTAPCWWASLRRRWAPSSYFLVSMIVTV